MKNKSNCEARRGKANNIVMTGCVIVGVSAVLGIPLSITAALVIGATVGYLGIVDGKSKK
jgi:hypothetical protein